MVFVESFEQADEYAQAALARMRKLRIPPAPRSFLLWYDYFTGRNVELVRALDILQSNQREFTPQLCAELFERFSGNQYDDALVRETSARVEGLVQQILALMGAAGEDSARYGDALRSFEGSLAGKGRAEGLRQLVDGILAETRKMAEQNEALEGELSRSSKEIEALRQDLVDSQREALTDTLTGVGNRKHFDFRLREAAGHALETGEPVSLVMVDIDHFKLFNDRYGHQIGDQVLKIVARSLTDQVKGRDTAARYGGEEFGVILPDTALVDAATVAEQIRRTVAGRHIVRRGTNQDFGVVTLSLGVAQYRLGEPLASLISRADEALYTAKRDGRNRVVTEAMLETAVAVERSSAAR